MGAVPDGAVLATQAETRAWFAASPKHGADWLMAMDLSVVDNADPPPFLGLNLNVNLNAGTNRNLGETNLHLNIGNPMSMLNARFVSPTCHIWIYLIGRACTRSYRETGGRADAERGQNGDQG